MCDIYSDKATSDYAFNNTHKSELMDFNLFKLLVKQSRDFITSYVVQLRGEPLLHPRIVDMVEFIRQEVPGASVWFNTNGLLLVPSLTDKMLAAGVNSINISIDAATAATYHSIRVGSNFDVLINNLNYLLEARENKKLPVRTGVAVSFVLQDANKNEKEAFLKQWLGKVEYVQIYAKVEFDRTRPTKFFEPEGLRQPCQSLWNSAAVLSDGIVVPCCGDLKPLEPLGSIYDKPLADLLAGGRYQDLRELHLHRKFKEIPLCKDCDTWAAYQSKEYFDESNGLKVVKTPFSETWTINKE